MTKLISIEFFHVSIVEQNEEVCSLFFETTEKFYLFVGGVVSLFDAIETDDMIYKNENFFSFKYVKLPFARGGKIIYYMLYSKYMP